MRRLLAGVILVSLIAQSTAMGGAAVSRPSSRYEIMHQAPPRPPARNRAPKRYSAASITATDGGSPGTPGTPVITGYPEYVMPFTVGTPVPNAQSLAKRRPMSGTPTPSPSSVPFSGTETTGILPWWTFNGDSLPGVGTYKVNVATGNLIVSSSDVDLGGPGVPLSYTRVYNSQSQHDVNNTDGSVQGNYGNDWTSTADMHIGWYNSGNTISVFDAAGTRYDYQYGGLDGNGNEIWTAPTGVYATLMREKDPNHPNLDSCFYQWLWPDGSAYFFYSSVTGKTCAGVNLNGRLAEIMAPNSKNYVQLTYSLDANHMPTQVVMTHSDGQSLTLTFWLYNSVRELHTITASTGQVITYKYDGSSLNNLQEVDEPPNGSFVQDSTSNALRTSINHKYFYLPVVNGGQMYLVYSPRVVMAQNEASPTDGDETQFAYDTSGRVDNVSYTGVVNLQPSDGTNTPIQPAPAPAAGSSYTWFVADYTYDTASGTPSDTCGTFVQPVSSFCDSFGHGTNWVTDSLGRVTETQVYSGNSQVANWQYTDATWDASNNLKETTDVAGYATDYGYDNYGNVIAVAQPAATAGAFRPTTLIKHGTNHPNNIQNTCDPAVTHAAGLDWDGVSTPATCSASTPGALRYTISFPDLTHEPNGRITDIYTPNGYHYAIGHAAASQPGGIDLGLPTSVTGDAISQSDAQHAPSSRQPTESLTYDAVGRILTMSNGVGTWNYGYTYYTTGGKLQVSLLEPGVTNASYACYAEDGTEIAAATPKQSGGVGCGSASPPAHEVTFVPDADGNVRQETHDYGNVQGVTQRWYDGADRLVEVLLPQDAHDLTHPYATRYLYDLGNGTPPATGIGDTVSFNDTISSYSYTTHGDLFKTQRYVPNGASVSTANYSTATYGWYDVEGNATDALGRTTQRIHLIPGAGRTVDTLTWDTSMLGRLTSMVNGVGDSVSVPANGYDQLGRVTKRTMAAGSDRYYFNGPLPGDQYTYDADGRVLTANSDATGTAIYSYDNDGDVKSYTEVPGGTAYNYPNALGGSMMTAISSATVYNFGYYNDDLTQGLTATGPGITTNTCSKQPGQTTCRDFSANGVSGGISQEVAYNADGNLAEQWGNYNNVSYEFFQTTDSDGRVTSKTDPLSSPAPSLSVAYDSATGLVNTWTIPSGTYTVGTHYDYESEPIEFTTSPAPLPLPLPTPTPSPGQTAAPTPTPPAPVTVGMSYSVRGELLTEDVVQSPEPSPSPSPIINYSPAAGFLVAPPGQRCFTSPVTGNTTCWPSTETWDPRVNAQIDVGNYDNAGRYINSTHQYDTLNRTLRSSNTGYSYGASTVPADSANVTTQTVANSWHAALNAPLYETGPSPTPPPSVTPSPTTPPLDVKVTDSSDITPQDKAYSGLTVYDRDMFGIAAAERTSNGTSPWSMHDLFSACEGTSGGAYGGNLSPGQIGYNGSALGKCAMSGGLFPFRSDGYWDGTLTIRGARTFDPATLQWNTPDAYGGTDAGSKYSYANNNPAMFVDPSGFEGCGFVKTSTPGVYQLSGCSAGCIYQGQSSDFSHEYIACADDGNDLFSDNPEFDAIMGSDMLPPVPTRPHCVGNPGGVTPPPKDNDGNDVSWSSIYQTGFDNSGDPQALARNEFNGGRFDFQMQGQRFRDAGNAGVGVYAVAAGLPDAAIIGLTKVAMFLNKNQDPERTLRWVEIGMNFARKHCGFNPS